MGGVAGINFLLKESHNSSNMSVFCRPVKWCALPWRLVVRATGPDNSNHHIEIHRYRHRNSWKKVRATSVVVGYQNFWQGSGKL